MPEVIKPSDKQIQEIDTLLAEALELKVTNISLSIQKAKKALRSTACYLCGYRTHSSEGQTKRVTVNPMYLIRSNCAVRKFG